MRLKEKVEAWLKDLFDKTEKRDMHAQTNGTKKGTKYR